MSDLSEQLVRGYNIDNITPLVGLRCMGGCCGGFRKSVMLSKRRSELAIKRVEVGATGLPGKTPPRGMQGVEAKAAPEDLLELLEDLVVAYIAFVGQELL